jgi:hypothetical protein
METLDKVLEHWSKDSVVDDTEPSREIIRVPVLHSKYLNIMSNHKLASKKAFFDYNRMRRLKWEYYTGKMSQEELEEHGWEPFRYTLKSDVTTYLEADNDLIRLLEKKVYHEEVVSVCEAILKELNNRTWQLREHMTHERFIQGAR